MLDYSIFTDLYPLEYKTGDCRFAPIPGYSVLGLFQSQISITTQPHERFYSCTLASGVHGCVIATHGGGVGRGSAI